MGTLLDKITEQYINTSSNPEDLWDISKFDNLNNALGGTEKANTLLITSSWQTILESPDLQNKIYPKTVGIASGTLIKLIKLEKFLKCLCNNKFCLLVFDPNFKFDEPLHIEASKGNSKKSKTTRIMMIMVKKEYYIITYYYEE
jgi:hypothetical protein